MQAAGAHNASLAAVAQFAAAPSLLQAADEDVGAQMQPFAQPAAPSRSQDADDDADDDDEDSDEDCDEDVGAPMQHVAHPDHQGASQDAAAQGQFSGEMIDHGHQFNLHNVVVSPERCDPLAGGRRQEAVIQDGFGGGDAFIVKPLVDAAYGCTGARAQSMAKDQLSILKDCDFSPFEKWLYENGLGRVVNLGGGDCLYHSAAQFADLSLTHPSYTPMQLRNMVVKLLIDQKGFLSQHTSSHVLIDGTRAYSILFGVDLVSVDDDTLKCMGLEPQKADSAEAVSRSWIFIH